MYMQIIHNTQDLYVELPIIYQSCFKPLCTPRKDVSAVAKQGANPPKSTINSPTTFYRITTTLSQ